ncbi:uncharacterized protein MYCFIDRAFT_114079 [Pseudocercospora fijiensis CIRAD86]
MAIVIASPPALSGDLSLFHTTDPLLGNNPVLVFYGPAATIGATSSRIQVHVFTPAGLASYARLSVSPNSPFYSAVSNLPREEQGDEVCRGLAFGLKKYFTELGDGVKKTWTAQVKAPSPGALFGDDHIAILATRMTKIENVHDVIGDILDAFCEQRLSWVDVDVVLPPGSIKERPSSSDGSEDLSDLEILKRQFGRYAELVHAFGEITFLPTSRLKRAPSKANAIGRTASFLRSQKENVRKQLDELVGTEQNYVNRMKELQDLSGNIGADLKDRHQQQLSVVFSPSIGKIVELNSAFAEEISKVVESTHSHAQEDIESSQDDLSTPQATPPPDSQGLDQVAQCLCEWLPQFAEAYQEYMSSHAQASQTLRTLLRAQDSLAQELQEIGEQKLTSLLIEPIQRLPRYNLYIDSIAKQLPVKHPALKLLLKARDIVTGICAENEGTEAAAMVERLRTRTMGWPLDIDVSGRLVAAVDYIELMPPYAFEGCDGARGMLFLFTDGVIMVEKSPTSKASARTLLTEMGSGSLPSMSVESLSDTIGDLHFVRRLQLEALQCTESHDGSALQLLTFFQLAAGALGAQEPILDSCQLLRLEGAYDGRVSRFVEEVAKARVESRFSEAERESSTWEFRATDPASDSLNLLSAIFDDSNVEHTRSRGPCAPIRVVVDPERHQTQVKPGHSDVRTVINLAPHRDGDWRLTIDSIDGNLGREHFDTPDLVPALRRKIASLTSARSASYKPPSRESRPTSKEGAAPFAITTDLAANQLKKMEDTLSAYILALQARKGNIVGKNLKLRLVADPGLVEELYSGLLEDPNMMVLAAQAPLDVLMAAFEKFLNIAWKDHIGQVMPTSLLQDIQAKAEALFPSEFDEYFKNALGRLAPQNQRAFKAIMKLLADLLDGTGNDGDRGILTACFAEVLVTDGNPHDYIALIDRFVDDTDTYFGEPVDVSMTHSYKDTGSVKSHKRARSVNSGSLTSNTSSLRRKFGLGGLTRENSKSEQESKVASVWRTLSKSTQPPALGMRPPSPDSKISAASFGDLPNIVRTPSSHNLGLSTIGEHPSFIPQGPPRKKRRSSLSDLKVLETSPKRETWSTPSPRRPVLTQKALEEKALPDSPARSTPGGEKQSELQRPKTSGGPADEVVITSRPTSNIPSLVPRATSPAKFTPSTPNRTGLSERPGAGNIVKKPSPQSEKIGRTRSTTVDVPGIPQPSPSRKLRMQSPQKLRERLQNEQNSIAAAQSSIQEELSKIGDELICSTSMRSPVRGGSRTVGGRGSSSQASNMDLAQRVLKMEGALPKQMSDLNTRVNSIHTDLSTSLTVSEAKCKKLDDLYREANGENEALYSKFNEELSRILKAVRGGEGVEELKRKLKEAQDEVVMLRRECSRVKRENVGLRAQLKE